MACGRRQVSWLPACLSPRLPGSAGALPVAWCGWPIRLQWRVRAGLAPASLRHRPLYAAKNNRGHVVSATEPFRGVARKSGYEPKRSRSQEADRRIRPGPLPARLEEARPERARLARHPEPSAHGRRRDVHALHDGHRDPHGDLPARPARHPRRGRSPGHRVPVLLGLRGALARRGVLRLPARLRHRGARRAEASGRLHPHAHPARPDQAAARAARRRPPARPAAHDARLDGHARLRRRAHDLGRDQRAVHAHRLLPAHPPLLAPGAAPDAEAGSSRTSGATSPSTARRPRHGSPTARGRDAWCGAR